VRAAPLSLLAVLLGAGCIASTSPPAGPTPAVVSALVAQDELGVTTLPPRYDAFNVSVFPTGFYRGEPTVGVTSDGVLFATASGPLVGKMPGGEGLIGRSTDGGKHWQIVQDPTRNAKTDVDPWLWVDPVTDRVFNAPLYIGCSWLSWSDDRGQTWDGTPLAGCGLPGHDHQKLTSGKPPASAAGGTYPTVVYYAYNSFRPDDATVKTGGTQVTVSRDGGKTFGASIRAHPADGCTAGINGPVVIGPDGAAYVPHPRCEGPAIARSDDAGTSWGAPVTVMGAGMGPLAFIHAAVDKNGTLYLLWPGKDQRLYLSHSADRATTWSPPLVVSRPDLKAVAYSAFDAGAGGRLGIAYIGTTDDPATWPNQSPGQAPAKAVWHFYAALTERADTDHPLVVTQKVTPDDDPVERGCITGSGDEPCRNLRDFIDAQVRGGRLYAVYADGCDHCKTDKDRLPRGETVVAVMETGPSLADLHPLSPLLGRS
jgi:hypothetical protein